MVFETYGRPYQGPASVPHAPVQAYVVTLASAHLGMLISRRNGYFGTEVHLRKYPLDYQLQVAQEGRNRASMRRGEDVTFISPGSPFDDDTAFDRKWFTHLHWKRWTQERLGPSYKPVKF